MVKLTTRDAIMDGERRPISIGSQASRPFTPGAPPVLETFEVPVAASSQAGYKLTDFKDASYRCLGLRNITWNSQTHFVATSGLSDNSNDKRTNAMSTSPETTSPEPILQVPTRPTGKKRPPPIKTLDAATAMKLMRKRREASEPKASPLIVNTNDSLALTTPFNKDDNDLLNFPLPPRTSRAELNGNKSWCSKAPSGTSQKFTHDQNSPCEKYAGYKVIPQFSASDEHELPNSQISTRTSSLGWYNNNSPLYGCGHWFKEEVANGNTPENYRGKRNHVLSVNKQPPNLGNPDAVLDAKSCYAASDQGGSIMIVDPNMQSKVEEWVDGLPDPNLPRGAMVDYEQAVAKKTIKEAEESEPLLSDTTPNCAVNGFTHTDKQKAPMALDKAKENESKNEARHQESEDISKQKKTLKSRRRSMLSILNLTTLRANQVSRGGPASISSPSLLDSTATASNKGTEVQNTETNNNETSFAYEPLPTLHSNARREQVGTSQMLFGSRRQTINAGASMSRDIATPTSAKGFKPDPLVEPRRIYFVETDVVEPMVVPAGRSFKTHVRMWSIRNRLRGRRGEAPPDIAYAAEPPPRQKLMIGEKPELTMSGGGILKDTRQLIKRKVNATVEGIKRRIVGYPTAIVEQPHDRLVQSTQHIRIGFFGPAGCGKTALIQRFARAMNDVDWRVHQPTNLEFYSHQLFHDGIRLHVESWDTSGDIDRDQFKDLQDLNFDAIVICISVESDALIAPVTRRWIPDAFANYPNIPVFLCATKIDYRGPSPTENHPHPLRSHPVHPINPRTPTLSPAPTLTPHTPNATPIVATASDSSTTSEAPAQFLPQIAMRSTSNVSLSMSMFRDIDNSINDNDSNSSSGSTLRGTPTPVACTMTDQRRPAGSRLGMLLLPRRRIHSGENNEDNADEDGAMGRMTPGGINGEDDEDDEDDDATDDDDDDAYEAMGDMAGLATKPATRITHAQGTKLAGSLGCTGYFECSAQANSGLKELYHGVAHEVLRRRLDAERRRVEVEVHRQDRRASGLIGM